MADLDALLTDLGTRFGVLAESNTYQLTVIAHNSDVAVGDLFLLPCKRGPHRFYIFRTTQYANVLNRTIEVNDVARNKLTMPDSYLAEDLREEQLIELKGLVLGYAQHEAATDTWSFHRPRRLPQHLTDVYLVNPGNLKVPGIMRTLLGSQLGEGLYLGDLLAGEQPLRGVPVCLPPFALSRHIGVFGRTGSGKSNLMMVLLRSILDHNRQVSEGERSDARVSILAIDPHDEFRNWHAAVGGAGGVGAIVGGYSAQQRAALVEPFYYLTAKEIPAPGLERRALLSRADLMPADLISVMDFSEQQVSFATQYYADHGEQWVGRLFVGDTDADDPDAGPQFLEATIAAVQRRIGFLRVGHTRVFTPFDPAAGRPYDSLLPDIICALETGRVLLIDTTLMSELEQFLFTTVVARVLFSLRKALRAAQSAADLEREIRQALGNDDNNGQVGMQSLADALMDRLGEGRLPYLAGEDLRTPDQLPFVNVVVEEAPSVLNPQRLRFGSVFRDISRQGRKFGIGLSVVSQQVSEIDQGVLTQLNTELNMALGNENERRDAIRNASADLMGFERELQVMGKGQVLVSASYMDVPLPIQVPNFDDLGS
ncbi:ATP-binding protein [uncultured Thiohalocapsa sp.]|uniref:ATP-binding protein n=1 Tax=uncultured Thiohalocapsa sp. TaxID=768990 RepID=UPI0025F8A4CC|nr:ATP-binding protein [uncultured Thiohalocapsa sp.]